MALTQISTSGIKDGTITGTDLATNIDLVDNQKLRLGTGNDLQIYHDGSNSRIHSPSHSLFIRTGNVAGFFNGDGTEDILKGTVNGAVELYYDNSKKFETSSSGTTTTGKSLINGGATARTIDVQTTHSSGGEIASFQNTVNGAYGGLVVSGGETNLECRLETAYGSSFMTFYANANERMRIDSSGRVLISNTLGLGGATSSPSGLLHAQTASGEGLIKIIGATNGVIQLSGYSGDSTINFGDSSSDSPGKLNYDHGTDSLAIKTNGSERMRIDSAGKVMINTTDNALGGVTGNLNIANTNTNNHTVINCSRNTANSRNQIRFLNPNGNVGSVVTGGTTTTFNTSSDYRLKENEVAISNGITRLKQLKPYRFNFKTDSSVILDGFFAHEVSSVVPEAITGTKDAVVTQAMIDAGDFVEGTLNDPIHQGIDQSKLVPLLTAALQEAIVRIEALEAG